MDPESQPKIRKWPLSRKKTILLLGGLTVFILIITAIILITRGNEESTGTQATSHAREGYDLQKLGSAFADPFAVKFTPNPQAINHKGNEVVQACNLLTIDDITEQDLLIKADTFPTSIMRTFNDGVGKADYSQSIYGSSLSDSTLGGDVNNCHYLLQTEESMPASIDINAFQPFTVPSDVIAEELQKNYTATGNIENLQVYTKKGSAPTESQGATQYIVLQQGKGAFYLSLDLSGEETTKKQTLLKTVAKNFIREQARPSGVSKLEYDSPVFPKSIVRACDLITNEHIRTLSGRDAGPLAREGAAPSIGKIRLAAQEGQESYLSIDNECTRGTAGGGSGLGSDGTGDLNLTVETITFLTDIPARRSIDLQRQSNPNNQESTSLSVKIGDASVGYADSNNGYHIAFSKGRIIVDIQLDQFAQRITKTTNLASALEKLTPIAQSMANGVNSD